MIFTFLIGFVIFANLAEAQECNVPGECVSGTPAGGVNAQGYNQCLQACQTAEDCAWFTYHGSSKTCDFFSDCQDTDDTNCDDCVSGEVTCAPNVPRCNVLGFCDGRMLGLSQVTSRMDCLRKCKFMTENCAWYTYDTSSSICCVFADCPFLDLGCGSCQSGEVTCPITDVENLD